MPTDSPFGWMSGGVRVGQLWGFGKHFFKVCGVLEGEPGAEVELEHTVTGDHIFVAVPTLVLSYQRFSA